MYWEDQHYAELLELLRGQVVGLVVNRFGNYGDHMIRRATGEMFTRNRIEWRSVDEQLLTASRLPSEITLLAEPGGGSLGTAVKGSPRRRRQLAKIALPKIILPQTAADPHEDLSAFQTVFAREQTTWQMLRSVHPDVRLAPDMALSLRLPSSTPDRLRGEFLRTDREATIPGCDPVAYCDSVEAYLKLAGRYQRVVTNRLHFALAAILQDQRCTLRPNSYHKNRSFYESWLTECPLVEWEE